MFFVCVVSFAVNGLACYATMLAPLCSFIFFLIAAFFQAQKKSFLFLPPSASVIDNLTLRIKTIHTKSNNKGVKAVPQISIRHQGVRAQWHVNYELETIVPYPQHLLSCDCPTPFFFFLLFSINSFIAFQFQML